MSDMCTCGNSYGKHIGLDCPDGKRHFILVEDVPRGVPVEDKPTPPEVAEAVQFLAGRMNARKAAENTRDPVRPALTWADSAPDFDPWKGFFTEPADMADWQDTYYPR
jgi:hypothetical protein